ncbi:hypothetical protein [Pyxidicoccus sp. MSG2]|uniref:hypothetical protein n=1 Tax=Pyxidicoccus sp. MSG2 TaxID=2996790 RepID=UPI0022714E0F|nr:hypothetical protein [Pyxidicoccus sp. MSG2]MCY1016660.1 hypothetical protein [Pyxidicoccus sp. MSG2]
MRCFSLRDALLLAPAALMLAACGGAPREGLDSATQEDSTLGTSEAGLSASLSCSRTSATTITCTATPTSGVAPFTYLWGQNGYLYVEDFSYSSTMNEGSATRTYYCDELPPGTPPSERIKPKFQLRDATGATTGTYLSADWYYCY